MSHTTCGRRFRAPEAASGALAPSRRPAARSARAGARRASGCCRRARRSPSGSPGSPWRRAPGRSGGCRRCGEERSPARVRARTPSRGELDRRRVGRDEAGGARGPARDLDVGAGGRGLAQAAARTPSRSRSTSCPGASRIETFAWASTGRTVFWRSGSPPGDAVARRARRRREGARGRSPWRLTRPAGRAPSPASTTSPGGSRSQDCELCRARRRRPSRSGSGVPVTAARAATRTWTAFIAAPPKMPEWRSFSPVRTVTWK